MKSKYYYDYKRKSFDTDDIMDKERTLRHMMKPNTWKEIEDMVYKAGFSDVQPFWRNHMFVGALAIKQEKTMYSKRLEMPRKGLIRQEIITIEEEDGQIVKRTDIRSYAEDGVDYLDSFKSEPLTYFKGKSA